MVKVTVSNVTRLAGNVLELSLKEAISFGDVSTQDLIEAELDRRDYLKNVTNKSLFERKEDQIKTNLINQTLIEYEIQALLKSFKLTKTQFLVEKLGHEFSDDYSIDHSNFTVYSIHINRDTNDLGTWFFCSSADCEAKVRELIYYRIYDRYMRDASESTLQALQRALS